MKERTQGIMVRLTLEEMAKFDQARGRLRRAVAVRLLLNDLKFPQPLPTVSAELLAELKRIGVNINQLARRFNEAEPDDATIKEAKKALAELTNKILSGVAG
jgi:hypothetical protein